MSPSNLPVQAAGFHHFALAVRDFDRSLRFYTEGLGLGKSRSWGTAPDRAAMLDAGEGSFLELFERPEDDSGTGRYLHLALRSGSTDEAHAAAVAAGAKEKVAPKDVDIPSDPVFPVRISFVYGPDGEEIEFFQER